MLYCVAHFLSTPYALITGSGMRAAEPPIGKFWSERCVCAPQSTSVLTSIGPKASLSVRVDSSRLSGSRIAAVARRASIGPAMPCASLGRTMPRIITDVGDGNPADTKHGATCVETVEQDGALASENP